MFHVQAQLGKLKHCSWRLPSQQRAGARGKAKHSQSLQRDSVNFSVVTSAPENTLSYSGPPHNYNRVHQRSSFLLLPAMAKIIQTGKNEGDKHQCTDLPNTVWITELEMLRPIPLLFFCGSAKAQAHWHIIHWSKHGILSFLFQPLGWSRQVIHL